MDIQTSRALGIIGGCLTVPGVVSGILSLIQFVNTGLASRSLLFLGISGIIGVFSFLGFVIFFMAMYGFSKAYSESRIFSYILWGMIITFVAMTIFVIVYLAMIFTNIGNITAPSQSQIATLTQTYTTPFLALAGFAMLPNVVLTVKSFYLLADKSQVHLFKNASKVLLAGAFLTAALGAMFAILANASSISFNSLTIAVVPGGIFQNLAWVFLTVAFFRIKPEQTQTQVAPTLSYAFFEKPVRIAEPQIKMNQYTAKALDKNHRTA